MGAGATAREIGGERERACGSSTVSLEVCRDGCFLSLCASVWLEVVKLLKVRCKSYKTPSRCKLTIARRCSTQTAGVPQKKKSSFLIYIVLLSTWLLLCHDRMSSLGHV